MSTFSTFDSTVNSFYLAFYGRPADPDGLKFWSAHLANNGGNLASITAVFANSEEAQVRFGTDTLGERIGEIYGQLFNRAPDAAGLAFWSNAITQGHATLADVAVAILGGAQGSDQTLSALRQQAADDFTAQVEASGTLYSGYASIEAARILVRAVTPTATADDLKALVNAAVSFADTATKNPAVVEAIAVNTTLLALFDTPRGTGDPVALAQALADTAKAAAGDPVTLEQLLRGGGMDKVLKVMPAAASLKDVVKALADGGLPAAVEVVYPTAPVVKPTPAASLKLHFDGVTQGEDDHVRDNVTNVKYADVTFKYDGKDLVAGQQFEYRIGGTEWTPLGAKDVDTFSNTVTIGHVDLSGMQTLTRGFVLPDNITTKVELRAVSGTTVLAKAEQVIVYDNAAPTAGISFKAVGAGSDGVATTPNTLAGVHFTLDSDLGDGIIEYQVGNTGKWTVLETKASVANDVFTVPDVNLAQADQIVQVRLIDAAGNVGDSVSQFIDGPAGVIMPPVIIPPVIMPPVILPPSFSIVETSAGLTVTSNFVGVIELAGDKTATAVKTTEGSTTSRIGTVTVGAQDTVVSGTFQLNFNGNIPFSSNTNYTLGTTAADTITGTRVFGFGGNDTITGTSGADAMWGGAGGDTLNLVKDSQADVVYYDRFDAVGQTFLDNGLTVEIDKIVNFGVGDSIRVASTLGATPVLHTTYLDGLNGESDYAVVRGTNADGHFVAGSSAGDQDYMLQWMDGSNVNSVILAGFGTVAPLLEISSHALTLLKPEPVITDFERGDFHLGNGPSTVEMVAAGGVAITALDKPANFKLVEVGPNGEQPAVQHDAGAGALGLHGPSLSFKTTLEVGLYSMSWTDDTFQTATGYLKASKVTFAGGVDGEFSHSGFAVGKTVMVDEDVASSSEALVSNAYVSDGIGNARILTGGGHDVVGDNGSALTVVYDEIDSTASDLILGFDSNDKVEFEGAAAALFDRDGSGTIVWEIGGLPLGIATEGVFLEINDPLATGDNSNFADTAATLNDYLGGTIGSSAHPLLVLVSGTDGGDMLFLYQNLNNNNVIDANELTTIAMFGHSEISTDTIQVIGVPESGGDPGGIPGG